MFLMFKKLTLATVILFLSGTNLFAQSNQVRALGAYYSEYVPGSGIYVANFALSTVNLSSGDVTFGPSVISSLPGALVKGASTKPANIDPSVSVFVGRLEDPTGNQYYGQELFFVWNGTTILGSSLLPWSQGFYDDVLFIERLGLVPSVNGSILLVRRDGAVYSLDYPYNFVNLTLLGNLSVITSSTTSPPDEIPSFYFDVVEQSLIYSVYSYATSSSVLRRFDLGTGQDFLLTSWPNSIQFVSGYADDMGSYVGSSGVMVRAYYYSPSSFFPGNVVSTVEDALIFNGQAPLFSQALPSTFAGNDKPSLPILHGAFQLLSIGYPGATTFYPQILGFDYSVPGVPQYIALPMQPASGSPLDAFTNGIRVNFLFAE